MDADLKVTALKTLQGLAWKEGCHQGVLKGQLFSEVPSYPKHQTVEGRENSG